MKHSELRAQHAEDGRTERVKAEHDFSPHPGQTYHAVFQGTSNGGRQFLSDRRSNRHIVPLYGKSDSLFTRERKFAQR
jgi:hypothetical protein